MCKIKVIMWEKISVAVLMSTIFASGGFYFATNYRLSKLEEKQKDTEYKVDSSIIELSKKWAEKYNVGIDPDKK